MLEGDLTRYVQLQKEAEGVFAHIEEDDSMMGTAGEDSESGVRE